MDRMLTLGSFSSDVFEPRTSTGRGLFALLSRNFEQILGQIVSLREKNTWQYKFGGVYAY